jgi:hypothetical protein
LTALCSSSTSSSSLRFISCSFSCNRVFLSSSNFLILSLYSIPPANSYN